MDQQNTLPDYDTAHDNLFGAVHAKVALDVLASRGYAPRTTKEAHELLDLVNKVGIAREHARQKEAADDRNPYHQANVGLDAVLGQYGITAPKTAASHDHELAVAGLARKYASDPTIFNSVLACKAEEARQAAQALNIAV